MPEITEYKVSDLTTAAQVDEGDFVELSQADPNVSGGKISTKATILSVANEVVSGINYTSALQTTDKTIVGAINEVAQGGGGGSDVEVTPILTEGTKIATITVDNVDADIYGENTKEELGKLSAEKTVDGNPVTLETVNGGMAKSCEVTMLPIQSGTGDPSPTNIRPISGWDGLNLTRTGKNLIDVADRTITSQTTIATGISLKAGTYTVSIQANNNTNIVGYFRITSGGATAISQITIPSGANARLSSTFTVDEDGQFSIICNGQSTGYNYTVSDIMLELGLTATEYEAYTAPQNKTITFPSTIYGGTDEVVSGNGKELWKDYLINDLTLSYSSSGQLFTSQEISGLLTPASSREMIDGNMCEFLKNHEVTGLENGQFAITTDGRIRIKIDGYTTEEELKTAFGSNKLTLKLVTPTPFSTEPTPIELLKGTNVVSTDGDSVEIKYSEMMNIDDVKLLIDAEGDGAIDYSTEEAEVPNFTFFGEKVYVKAFTFSNVNIGGAIVLMTAPSYIGHIVKAWMYTTNESGVEFTSFPAVWVHEGNLYINPYYNSTAVTGKIVLYYTKTS